MLKDMGAMGLASFWTRCSKSTKEESMPMLTLTGMPSHHRHVFLTAEVLVTMRPW